MSLTFIALSPSPWMLPWSRASSRCTFDYHQRLLIASLLWGLAGTSIFVLIIFLLTITYGIRERFLNMLLNPFWPGPTFISILIFRPFPVYAVLRAKLLAAPTLAICPMDVSDSFPAWCTSPPLPSAESLKTQIKCHILCEASPASLGRSKMRRLFFWATR